MTNLPLSNTLPIQTMSQIGIRLTSQLLRDIGIHVVSGKLLKYTSTTLCHKISVISLVVFGTPSYHPTPLASHSLLTRPTTQGFPTQWQTQTIALGQPTKVLLSEEPIRTVTDSTLKPLNPYKWTNMHYTLQSPDDDQSKLVETLRPTKNSLRGSVVNNEKSPRSTLRKQQSQPISYLPPRQQLISRTVLFRTEKSPEFRIIYSAAVE